MAHSHWDDNSPNLPPDATPAGDGRLAAHPAADRLQALAILENVSDAFVALDAQWRIIHANREACRINQKPLEEFQGKIHWDEWPAAVGTALEFQFRRVMERREVAHFEHRYVLHPYDVWLEIDVYPSEDGINLFYRDISERKRAEESLRQSEARYRSLVKAMSQIVWTNSAEGEMRGPNPDWSAFTGQSEAEYLGFGWADAVHPDDAQPTIDAWNQCVADRQPFIFTHRVRRHDGDYRTFAVRAAPVTEADGALREWVGIHTDITERAALEVERENLLAQAQSRAEREALINRIGQAMRRADNPHLILVTAVRELGEALRADRCYYARYDLEADRAAVGPEWRRGSLAPIAGEYAMSRFAVNRDPGYRAGRTQAVTDTNGDPATTQLGLRALVRVPIVAGALMTTLSVAMCDGPRTWTADEISLVETVAAQTQSALELVRAHQREHNIAERLQQALQPPLPEGVPGLALAKYYEAALAEAGVGGDFYDAFTLDKGCTALIVGDLSGKGLAAAAQVSTVRNMLRAFLYSSTTLADAVTNLNRVLALNSLLTGFATLFAGCYDQASGELAYVNCGQEPALVRRIATEAVEELMPTGPVLGANENAAYAEQVVTLAAGDVLAIFTDGVTECGPSRQQMLGIEGVAALLEQSASAAGQPADHAAEAIALRLVEGVDAASLGGVARDDVCLLVAVVNGGP